MVHISFEIFSKFQFYSPMAAALVNKIRFTACGGGWQKNGKFCEFGKKNGKFCEFGEEKWQIGRILANIYHYSPKIGQKRPKYA